MVCFIALACTMRQHGEQAYNIMMGEGSDLVAADADAGKDADADADGTYR